uniref:Protein FAR1-RELATED SEQUENCE n=1 Tax=Triticum urartu TaxID=4572 RepID=A0A8R7UKG2_TRIUA
MPLWVFVGVNNHLQSIIFGVALVGNESSDSFEWIFNAFKRCMRKDPTCILTDQCPAMKAAIPKVFLRTHHRLCRWHIMKKIKDHLSKLYSEHDTFKEDLTAVLNHPLMPAEFEAAWHDLMDRYNLQNDTILLGLWEERTTWISTYWKEIFCARMTSTQRSESMNNILKKGFVKETQVLHILARQVNECIQKRHQLEVAETIASTGVKNPFTRYLFEKQLMDVYTRAVYNLFRERLFESGPFRIK